MAIRLQFGRPASVPEMRIDAGSLYLRPALERDWAAWARLREQSRAHLEPWEPAWTADALSRDSFRRRVKRYGETWNADQGYALLLLRQADEALLGGVTISNVRRGVVQAGSLGYWIGAPFAGAGLMTQGVRAVLAFAFNKLALHRVEAACLPHNKASRAVLGKCGFQPEGLARRYLCIAGSWQDHVLFGLLEDEWRAAAWSEQRREAARSPATPVGASSPPVSMLRSASPTGGAQPPGSQIDRKA